MGNGLEPKATMEQIEDMGMAVDHWKFGECWANVGTGDKWATIYIVRSGNPGKGEAQELCKQMRGHYESEGKRFASSVPINPRMQHILDKLQIPYYA